MVQLFSQEQSYLINVPTSLSEISAEYLQKVTDHIHVAEHFAIVALVLTTKLSEYCYTINNPNGKAPTIGVTPILVKFNSNEATSHLKVGDIVIISDTDLERGNHLNVPSIITSDRVGAYLMSDAKYIKDIQIGEAKDDKGNRIGDSMVKLLQFKVVPVCDIHASYGHVDSIVDDFLVSAKKD